MNRRKAIQSFLYVSVILFIGFLGINSNLLSNALGTAFMPDSALVAQSEMNETEAQEDTSLLAEFQIPGSFIPAAYRQRVPVVDVRKLEPLPPVRLNTLDAETLWLARGIYSETKRPEEQELVAWVIRNRVESMYRGKSTYQDVVLDPFQFSAFNPGTPTREFYTSLKPVSKSAGWGRALAIAERVRTSPSKVRPFPLDTRHFYSEQSMVGRSQPEWATAKQPVDPARPVKLEAERFRFYAGVR